MRLILELPAEHLKAETNSETILGAIEMLQNVCGCEIVVSKAGLGNLIADELESRGVPFKLIDDYTETWQWIETVGTFACWRRL